MQACRDKILGYRTHGTIWGKVYACFHDQMSNQEIIFFIKVNRIGTKYLELLANMYNQEVTCRAIFTVLLNKRGGGQRIAVAGTK